MDRRRLRDRARAMLEHVVGSDEDVSRQAARDARGHGGYVGELERTLGRVFRGQGRAQATAATTATVAKVASAATAARFGELGAQLRASAAGAVEGGLARLAATVATVRGDPGPLVEANLRELSRGARVRQMEVLRERAAIHAGVDAARDVRAAVALVRVGEERVDSAIRRALSAADGQAWRAMRVARTEASYAFNAAQDEGILMANREGLRVMKRWTERVNDSTGAPMDSRVALDSLAMHGQVAEADALFTMPAWAHVPARLIGQSWYHPPNRPNDRAVLLPWAKGWGIPGWTYRG